MLDPVLAAPTPTDRRTLRCNPAGAELKSNQFSTISRHAQSAARRAEAAALAGKGDDVFMAAAVALDAHEAVFESPAAHVVLELAQHEAGQRGLVTLEFTPQGRQMLLDDRIERSVLWPMALVVVA